MNSTARSATLLMAFILLYTGITTGATASTTTGFALRVATVTTNANVSGDVSGDAGRAEESSKTLSQFPDVSATYQLSHRASGTLLESVHVQASAYGLLIRQASGATGSSIVFNSVTDQLWLVDARRRVYHEVPISALHVKTQLYSEATRATNSRVQDSTPDRLGEAMTVAPFLQYQPCIGMDGLLNSEVMVHGRKLQLWHCYWKQELIETQWYDADLALVVRGISEDGYLSELLDIQRIQYSPEHFVPPATYRTVNVNEFMNRGVNIEPYDEVGAQEYGVKNSTFSLNGFANQKFPNQQLR